MSDLAYSIRLPQGDYPLTRAGDEYQERYVYDSECYGGQGDVKYAILENGVLQLHRKQGNGHVPCWQGRCIGIVGRYTQVQEFNEYNQKDLYPQVEVVEGIAASPISAALDERLAVVKPVCEACPEYRGMKGTYVVNCRARSGGCCGGVSVNFGCPKGYWDKTLYAKGMFDIQKITKQTDPHVITDIILNNDGWRNPGLPYGWQNWPNIQEAYRWALSGVKIGELKPSSGRGICILAGGKYFAGGYASIRQIRATGCELPIELWLLPGEELTVWQQKAIEGLGVTPRVVVDHVCGGWQSKYNCLLHSEFSECLFFDADCYPLVDPNIAFEWPEYTDTGCYLWLDRWKQHQNDGSPGALLSKTLMEILGFPYVNEMTKDSGVMLIDKSRHGKALQLADWCNRLNWRYYYRGTQ